MTGAVRPTLIALLAALAVAAGLLAADVRAWRGAVARGDAVFAVAPARASWLPPTRLGGAAEALLGVRDDVELRRALQLYVQASGLQLRLDNAVGVETARAQAQDALLRAARTHDPRRRAQALTLLGILVYRSSPSGSDGAPSDVDAAESDFAAAVRSDPQDAAAVFDLELLFRLTAAHGRRTGPGPGSGPGRTGRRGAGAGLPGSGY